MNIINSASCIYIVWIWYIYIYMYTYVCVYMCLYIYVYIFIYLYTHIYIYLYILIYIYIYHIYMYIYIYVYIYIVFIYFIFRTNRFTLFMTYTEIRWWPPAYLRESWLHQCCYPAALYRYEVYWSGFWQSKSVRFHTGAPIDRLILQTRQLRNIIRKCTRVKPITATRPHWSHPGF